MDERMKNVYRVMHEAHAKMYVALQEIDTTVKHCSNVKELADYAFALRETAAMADDTRKTCEAIQRLAERICCAITVKDGLEGPVRTDYVTATPTVKMMASLPNKTREPDQYKRLLEHFGLDCELAEEDGVRFHWPGMVRHISKLAEEGRPLPPGLDVEKTYPVYGLSPMKKRKGIELG